MRSCSAPTMPTPPRAAPAICAVAASGIHAFIENQGIAATTVLRNAGLRSDDFTDPLTQLPLADYCNLLEQAARHTGLDRFGLRFGLSRGIHLIGDLGDLASCAPTLGAALAALCRNFPALQEQSELRLRRDQTHAYLEYRVRDGRIIARRQDAELTLGVMVRLLRQVLGPGFAPDEVSFEHVRPSDRAEYHMLLGADVTFNAEVNAIVLRTEVLATPMPRPDPARGALIEASLRGRAGYGRGDDFVGLVREEMRVAIARGHPVLHPLVCHFGTTESSLYRRLRAEGMTFADLLRGVRREVAINLLGEPHIPLSEIAFMLGYSEQSAFTRAFRAWTGVNPSRYRAAMRLLVEPIGIEPTTS